MRVIFRTRRGQEVGGLSFLDTLLVAFLLVAILDIFIDARVESMEDLFKVLMERFFSATASQDSVLSFFLLVLTGAAVLFAVWRTMLILLRVTSYYIRWFTQRSSGLLMKKLFQELRSCNVRSLSEFQDSTKRGKDTEDSIKLFKEFMKEQNNGTTGGHAGPSMDTGEPFDICSIVPPLSEQTHGSDQVASGGGSELLSNSVWSADWTYWDRNPCPEMRRIRQFNISSCEFRRDRKATNKKIKMESGKNYIPTRFPEIVFSVSVLQPSIIHAARRVIKRNKLESKVKLRVQTTTGPHTVAEAIKRKCKSSSEFMSFAAPLAAFSMFEFDREYPKSHESHESPEFVANPTAFFVPLVGLVEERQEIFFLQDYSRDPQSSSKAKLYFYDNSTSEECVANLTEDLRERYEPKAIRNYDAFKAKLHSEYSTSSMEPGDAIALWEPLITYYSNRPVGNGVLTQFSERGSYTHYSQIFLFVDKSIEELGEEPRAHVLAFFRALILEMRLLSRRTEYARWWVPFLMPIWLRTGGTFCLRCNYGKRFRDAY